MREAVLLVPSLQVRSWDASTRETSVLKALAGRLEAEGYRIHLDAVAQTGRREKFSETFAEAAKGADRVHVVAVSSSGDFVLEWLENTQHEVHAVLIGTFPSRRYKTRAPVTLFYGSEDYVAYVEEPGQADIRNAVGPAEYADEQAQMIDGPASVQIVSGADHFLYPAEKTEALPLISASLLSARARAGIAAFGENANQFLASPIHAAPRSATAASNLIAGAANLAIADIGCGAGHWGISLARAQDELTFIDPAPAMLEKALGNAAARGVKAQAVLSPAEKIEIGEARFDVATSRLALHHFTDVAGALSEMVRIVKRGGNVVICDLAAPADAGARRLQHEIEVLHDPSHVRCQTDQELSELMTRSGLSGVQRIDAGWESADGIPLQLWCDMVGTGTESRRELNTKLSLLSCSELHALGFSKKQGEFHYHAPTFTLMGTKE